MCLTGEPDERTQHEGVTPLLQTKYAINGWMRAKHLGGHHSQSALHHTTMANKKLR